MSRVIHITDEKQFNKLISAKDRLIVVLFTTEECKPCRKVEKEFGKISQEVGEGKGGEGVDFLQVTDGFGLINKRLINKLIARFLIIDIPIIQFFRNGLFLTEICKTQKNGCPELLKTFRKTLPIVMKYIKTPKGYYYRVEANGKKRRVSEDEYLTALSRAIK